MGIEWTLGALWAALDSYWGHGWDSALEEKHAQNRVNAMRDALDAAVKAQTEGVLSTAGPKLEFAMEAYRQGRADALEEAAKFFEDGEKLMGDAIAKSIRALKNASSTVEE